MGHFFFTDLPLPLARALKLDRMAPPGRVRELHAELQDLVLRAGICHLSAAERALLEVPEVDSWYQIMRTGKLTELEDLLKLDAHVAGHTQVTPQHLDELLKGVHCLGCLLRAVEFIRRDAEDGVFTTDFLLSLAFRRIERAVRARLMRLAGPPGDALRRRWAALTATASQAPPGPDPEDAPGGPPRSLETLAAAIRADLLHEASKRALDLLDKTGCPPILPRTHDRKDRRADKKALRAQLAQEQVPGAALLIRACLQDLYPEAPWLAKKSGIGPDSLALLLEWRESFAAYAALGERVGEDLPDMERLFWQRCRGVIRTAFADIARGLCADLHLALGEEERSKARARLCMFIDDLGRGVRSSPPPAQVAAWERERREAVERMWRERLGCSILAQPR